MWGTNLCTEKLSNIHHMDFPLQGIRKYTTQVPEQGGQKLLSLFGQKKITKLDFMTHLLLRARPINQEKGETKRRN